MNKYAFILDSVNQEVVEIEGDELAFVDRVALVYRDGEAVGIVPRFEAAKRVDQPTCTRCPCGH